MKNWLRRRISLLGRATDKSYDAKKHRAVPPGSMHARWQAYVAPPLHDQTAALEGAVALDMRNPVMFVDK